MRESYFECAVVGTMRERVYAIRELARFFTLCAQASLPSITEREFLDKKRGHLVIIRVPKIQADKSNVARDNAYSLTSEIGACAIEYRIYI